MDLKNLDLANQLVKDIQVLKDGKGVFNPENKYVYLQISDHYGNKGGVIQTYKSNPKINSDLESFIAREYGDFLKKVTLEFEKNIECLEKKLTEL
jgi:hypothetical protein